MNPRRVVIVAKLKNLATLKLTNTPVTDAWVKDFERTRPEAQAFGEVIVAMAPRGDAR